MCIFFVPVSFVCVWFLFVRGVSIRYQSKETGTHKVDTEKWENFIHNSYKKQEIHKLVQVAASASLQNDKIVPSEAKTENG